MEGPNTVSADIADPTVGRDGNVQNEGSAVILLAVSRFAEYD